MNLLTWTDKRCYAAETEVLTFLQPAQLINTFIRKLADLASSLPRIAALFLVVRKALWTIAGVALDGPRLPTDVANVGSQQIKAKYYISREPWVIQSAQLPSDA